MLVCMLIGVCRYEAVTGGTAAGLQVALGR